MKRLIEINLSIERWSLWQENITLRKEAQDEEITGEELQELGLGGSEVLDLQLLEMFGSEKAGTAFGGSRIGPTEVKPSQVGAPLQIFEPSVLRAFFPLPTLIGLDRADDRSSRKKWHKLKERYMPQLQQELSLGGFCWSVQMNGTDRITGPDKNFSLSGGPFV